MKYARRRRHLRPRPSRAQIHQQLNRTRRRKPVRAEWLLEAQQEQPRPAHLRFVHDRVAEINHAIGHLEAE